MRPERAGDGAARSSERATNALPAWLTNIAVWVGIALAVAVLVVLGVAVLPGWWASQIGAWVQGVFGRGVPLGLGIGALFTVLPLGVGVLALRSGLTSRVRIALIVIALLLLLPNVLTIAIALGSGDARSVLAITAPGFRGATAAGIGLVILATIALLVIRRRSRRTRSTIEEAGEKAKKLARERAEAPSRTTENTDPGPAATSGHPAAVEPGDAGSTVVSEPPSGPRAG